MFRGPEGQNPRFSTFSDFVTLASKFIRISLDITKRDYCRINLCLWRCIRLNFWMNLIQFCTEPNEIFHFRRSPFLGESWNSNFLWFGVISRPRRHHFQQFRRAAAQSKWFAPRLRAAPHFAFACCAEKCSSLLSAVPWSILWFFIRLLQHLCAHALDVCTRKADSHFSCGRHAEVFFSIDFVSGFLVAGACPEGSRVAQGRTYWGVLGQLFHSSCFLFCSSMASSHDARNLPQSAWLFLFVNTSMISSSSNVRRVLRTPPHFCLSKVSATSENFVWNVCEFFT